MNVAVNLTKTILYNRKDEKNEDQKFSGAEV